MAEINSPLGKQIIEQNRRYAEGNMKTYKVENESYDNQHEHHEPIDRSVERHNKNQISVFGKKRIELLAGIGRSFKDVVIDGHKFTLQTLKSKENMNILLKLSQMNGIQFMFEARRLYLAHTLYKIDDELIEDVIGANSIEDKLELVDNLGDIVTLALHKCYTELDNETRINYGVPTEEAAKEVVADVKK